MNFSRSTLILASVLAAGGAQAQFAGAPFFLLGPSTQAPGPVVNTLIVSSTPSGMVVSGTFSVTLPAGTYSGTLLQFTAVRPMQVPAWGPPLTTTVTLPGTDFISNPPGNLSALGQAYSSMDTVPGSYVTTGLWPNTGAGTNFYNGGFGYLVTSPSYTYAGGAGNFLRLTYDLDFNYSGTGGTYFFTFPLSASLNTVPEPVSIVVLGSGILMVLRRRKKS